MDNRDLLDSLASFYLLKEVEIIENIVSWGGTLRAKINSSNGECFVKEKVVYLTSEEFKQKTLIHQELFFLNAPVVPILKNIEGLPYTSVDGGRLFEVMPLVKGVGAERKKNHLEKLAFSLAEIQKCSNENLFNRISKNRIWTYPTKRQELFPDKPFYIQKYLSFLNKSKISDAFDKSLINRIIGLNADLLSRITWNDLAHSWIHGDPGLDNALICKEKTLIFDLDNIRIGYKIWDLVRLCSLLGAFEYLDAPYKGLYKDWNIDEISFLINGFQESLALDKNDYKNFPFLMGISLIMNFIAEFDLDDSFDPTFKCFSKDMNQEFEKLIKLVEDVKTKKLF